ncbi:hypothetical protein V1L54_26515 [Streptomyces sp. TRM 70361]|uniref:hypothetical protein n=1 Tax=Streptomyces sp. TRM 70361 TaxID=3116553 RepID=UPI002E7C14E8|nr:hypothetical protein [Streptomyces sp. TRM 70361]MEE1942919.1 hypothetical protein [Streptomyces sp. TRM 70361]
MTVDRAAVVARHRVVAGGILGQCPLAVGNGEFAFTVDVTGLQSLPDHYPLPDRYGQGAGTLLATMAQWGWHCLPPRGEEGRGLASTMRRYDTAHGPADFVDLGGTLSATAQDGLTPAEEWLRANPHRLDLARIGLWTADAADAAGPGSTVRAADLSGVRQELDPARGVITSRFRLRGRGFTVRTAVHPRRDAVGVEITAEEGAAVGLTLAFPYGSGAWGNAADWSRPDAHRTRLCRERGGRHVERTLDGTRYTVRVHGPGLTVEDGDGGDGGDGTGGPHRITVRGSGSRLVCAVEFAPGGTPDGPDLTGEEVLAAAASGWASFWSSGAAVDLSGSTDPRAAELERRIVLSQYLTRIHCAGSLPPAETGLTANSWRGKFHLEMHWWHAAHFPAWGRPELLERSLAWYDTVRPRARATAARQHLPGARWPKQTGPSGEETPSDIGPFLLWQQPHPVHLAELVRRARPGDRETLERWAPLVLDTAAFMAALPERTPRGFELAPPLVPAQESYAADRRRLRNPTFELAYWAWALGVANDWRVRLGLRGCERWRRVAEGLVPLRVRDGVYAAIGVPPYTLRTDHPSMLGALGVVPATPLVDPAVMERTLESVLADWDWDSAWGWDFPMAAMTATRLGRPDLAVRALLLDVPKNRHLPNGHNRQDDSLPLYLPGNGGLLAAVALMAGGWDGAARTAPGFGPGWSVRHEGFVPLP